ncbi:MAG: LLM class flavin-dependent oxidoreductase [SAR324 cluster bacterium]|nr:LLM class flavin-dependent oxidoreductase [SAR324 cluster bacterium]
MSIPQKIALTLPHPEGLAGTLSRAVWAEERGFDDVWFADVSGADALTTAAVVAERTERVRIGTAIIPVFTRTPGVFAATTYVLNKISQGRFVLGLGSSSHTMMENWHGLAYEKPLTRVKETATLVRSMLNGEKSDFNGLSISSRGYRQDPVEPGSQPIFLAGLRPRMLEMAAEFGDGVILNLFPKDALPKMMAHIAIGAERAGKTNAEREIVCRHQVIVTEDKDSARDLFRKGFAPYYATPVYNKFLAWAGYQHAADSIAEGWKQRDRAKTGSALSDELIDQIAIIGSKEECQERIRAYAEEGIHTHIISCISPGETEQTQEAFAPDNFSF